MIPDVTSSKIRLREVVLFSALAYAVSWGWWAQLVLPRVRSLSLFDPLPELSTNPGVAKLALGMFGPMIAALVMRVFVSKDGLKGSLGLLRSWRWYAIAVAS